MKIPSIMFIAGDPSGDQHAAPIIKKLTVCCPQVKTWGIGGQAMAAAGFEQILPFEQFNRMGYVEVLKHLPFFLSAKKHLINLMKSRRPDALVCVDYPGFNMPVMKAAHKLNIPVIWYIAPMVWAWKSGRAKALGAYASHIATIFPFEVPYFSPFKAPVTFVGNPLCESLPAIENTVKKFPADGAFRLAVIPGSRPQEIKNMLEIMLGAADLLKTRHPRIKVTVSRFKGFDETLFETAKQRGIELFNGPLCELLKKSDLALVTSGTASLEAALMGVPMIITYRTSAISYAIYRSLIKVPFIGLPNIIAQAPVVPECIQNEAGPEILANHMNRFLYEPRYWEETAKNLSALRARLGEKTPSSEVADIIQKIAVNGRLPEKQNFIDTSS
ncbi:MAG: lipid-A-disaccharide synthase [Chitinispirillales bacterium]|nr:lipid-A-disaccharide synthase [Chitinispirillales bacterium]